MCFYYEGTGKSFIGAILAKFIHDYSEQTILVVCYTNHAASYLAIMPYLLLMAFFLSWTNFLKNSLVLVSRAKALFV
jgi:hypothetical protein